MSPIGSLTLLRKDGSRVIEQDHDGIHTCRFVQLAVKLHYPAKIRTRDRERADNRPVEGNSLTGNDAPKPHSATKKENDKKRQETIINELADILTDEPILVISTDWRPLSITRRHRHAQKLLDTGKARLINQTPYVIQLKYEIKQPEKPRYALGMDPGRTNIGVCVTDLKTGQVVFSFELETRNKEIPGLMRDRKGYRQTRRRGERKVRLRRSHKLNQENKELSRDGGRIYRRGTDGEWVVPIKGIINQESRFDNRKREPGWLTPTATQLKRTMKNLIKKIGKWIPLRDVCLEMNRFAFMELEAKEAGDPVLYGVDYQKGRLRGFASVEDYVSNLQEGKCAMPGCDHGIDHYHHITPASKGGSNHPENLAGLCEECHKALHRGEKSLPDEGEFKRFAGASVLNQVMPSLTRELFEEWGSHFHLCSGFETKLARERLGLPKTHDADAVAIVAACLDIEPWGWGDYRYKMCQYRRQDRARIRAQFERAYKLDGKTIAKNRKPRSEQPKNVPALSTAGLSREDISRLSVSPSRRSYNRLDRVMPGAVFEVGGRYCVLTGQQGRGAYLLFKHDLVDDKGKPVPIKASDARLVHYNKGMVFVGRLIDDV